MTVSPIDDIIKQTTAYLRTDTELSSLLDQGLWVKRPPTSRAAKGNWGYVELGVSLPTYLLCGEAWRDNIIHVYVGSKEYDVIVKASECITSKLHDVTFTTTGYDLLDYSVRDIRDIPVSLVDNEEFFLRGIDIQVKIATQN